jgi:uncharacterized DUF497 family protein
MDFEWDADNLAHIARHRLTAAEVEAILACSDTEFSGPYTRNGQWRVLATGPRADGRIVNVVFEQHAGVTRVVTAYPASPRTQREYRELHP